MSGVKFGIMSKISSLNLKKTAIYGIGELTKQFLLQLREHVNIICLLDGFQREGEKFGLPIMSMECALLEGVDDIIIVARSSSTKIVFERIKMFCINHRINVYDVNGMDLIEESRKIKCSTEFETETVEELKKQIALHKVISFDIFDTLVCRKYLFVEDMLCKVFDRCKIEGVKLSDYLRYRRKAEMLRESGNINAISDIYDYIQEQLKLTDVERRKLENAEIQEEIDNIIPRKRIVQLFNDIKESGKKVYIVSDMYLGRDILEEILLDAGITGYQKLFISCEENTDKQGNLFNLLLEHAGCLPEEVLHIGDSEEDDRQAAINRGMDAFKICGIYEMISKSVFNTDFWTSSLEERCLIGTSLSVLFNNPFLMSKNGKIVAEDAYDVAYTFFAPAICACTMWLINVGKERELTDLLLAARDGFLINEMYQMVVRCLGVENCPRVHYFYTSRVATVSATIENGDDLAYATTMPFDGSLEELLSIRFDIDLSGSKKEESIFSFLQQIINRSRKLRQNYLKYINQLKLGEQIGFFDFVSSGTCQEGIERILGKKMQGLYFIRVNTIDERKKCLNIQEYAGEDSSYYENYFLLEYLISAPEKTIRQFDENGKPVFDSEVLDESNLALLKKCQRAILDYFNDTMHIWKNISLEKGKSYASAIFELYNKQCISLEITGLDNVYIKDNFCNRTIKL